MKAWVMVRGHGALRGVTSEETLQLVLESSKHRTRLRIFSSEKQDISGKKNTVMESLPDHISAFVPPSWVTTLGRSHSVAHMSLAEFFRLVLSLIDGKEALQG